MIAEKGTISKSEMEIVKKSDADINTNTIAIIPTTDITINGSVFDYNWLDNKDTSKHQNNNTFDALLSDCGLTNYSALEVNDFDELLLKHASCNYICKDDCLYSKDFDNISIDHNNFGEYNNEKVLIDRVNEIDYSIDSFAELIAPDIMLKKRCESEFEDEWDNNQELFNYLKKPYVI